jgi:hypothetical protein
VEKIAPDDEEGAERNDLQRSAAPGGSSGASVRR